MVRDRRTTSIAIALIVTLTLVAWGRALGGAFQFDDIGNVVHDPATTDAAVLLERLLHGLRPLTRLTYFADAHVFGMHAAGFLATNLLLHVATALLVFGLARRRIDIAGATVAALIFALQPANGEVVAYVSGRSTGLMTPLLLGGLLLHDRRQRGGAVCLFLLACTAKEVALVFPLIVLVWDATGDRVRLRDLAIYVAAAIAIAIVVLTRARYQSLLGYSFELRSMPRSLLANGRAIPEMLSLWVRPWSLSVDHDFGVDGSTLMAVAGLALLAGSLVAAFALRRRHGAISLALAWPIIALLPTSSIIAKIDLVTEKPLYLAWVGPSIALGIAFSTLGRRRTSVAAAAIVVCALAATCVWRASTWRDPIRLWQEATAKAPRKARCWNNLGIAYRSAGRDADAVAAFQRAVSLDPSNERAALNLATARILADPN